MVHVVVMVLLLLSAPASAEERAWPGETWAPITPSEAGMDAARLEEALAFAGDHRSRAVVIVRAGRVVAERYWGGWTAESKGDMFSAQKSVTSVIVGTAIARGDLPDLDTAVAEYFPSWLGTPKEGITVRHLITMTSGLHASPRSDLFAHMRVEDKTAFTLELSLDHPPGTTWAYGNPAYALLIAVLERATGKDRDTYLRELLFDPIGMRHSSAGLMPVGRIPFLSLTHHGIETTARDMARFGLLALRGGMWRETRIVSEDWLTRSTTDARPDNPAYGWLWWLNRGEQHKLPYSDEVHPTRLFPNSPPDAFAALGARDSKIYVVPSLDLVITRLGESASRRGGVAPTVFDDGFLSRVCAAVVE